jgi:isopenicillin N synthase-like dioxygenase
VVAMGQGMESITQGICTSTTHRVISPEAGLGARYSIPFFQGVGLEAKFEAMKVPEELRTQLVKDKKKSDVEFTFTRDAGFSCLGEAILVNRVGTLRIRLTVGEKPSGCGGAVLSGSVGQD